MTHVGWFVTGLLIGGGFGIIAGWHAAMRFAIGEANDVVTLVERSNDEAPGDWPRSPM